MALAGFPDHLEQAAKEVLSKQLSVRQTEELVAKLLNPEDQKEKPEAGARRLIRMSAKLSAAWKDHWA